jgi:mono/diheme cytochrome c family protein
MTYESQTEAEQPVEAPLHGLLAEYETPGALLRAARKVRDAGYSKWDTYTPFPVHGMEKAMGVPMTGLPWIVLIGGLTGLTTAVLLQWWTNAHDYPWVVSGKPLWSIPANVPIYFELMVLFSAFCAFFGMLILNGLPHPSHPLDLKRRFARSTDDRFFLLVEAADPQFDESDTRELLAATAPAALEDLSEDRTTPDKLPVGMVYGLVIVASATLVPFALIAMLRQSKNDEPRIHAIADMDWQPKYKAQRENTFFADKRAMRDPVPGTVAVGALDDDDHFYRGKLEGAWARTFPEQLPLTADSMERGRERFGIYCAPCHGLTGMGNGMVAQRADQVPDKTWVPPTDMTQEHIRLQPVGQLYNTITHGIRNMPAYGAQIKPADRWAIVLYMRALQRTRAAGLEDLTPEERRELTMK